MVLAMGSLWRYEQTRAEMEAALLEKQIVSTRLTELTEKTQLLEKEIERLKDDPGFIEVLARQNLGLIREGDMVISLDSGEALTSYRLTSGMSSSIFETGFEKAERDSHRDPKGWAESR
jgi:hypothetical protein